MLYVFIRSYYGTGQILGLPAGQRDEPVQGTGKTQSPAELQEESTHESATPAASHKEM